MAILLLLNFFFALCCFKEPPRAPPQSQPIRHGSDSIETGIEVKHVARSGTLGDDFSGGHPLDAGSSGEAERRGSMVRGSQWKALATLFGDGAVVSFFIGWTMNFTLSGLEASLPVMTQRAFGWDVVKNAVM